MSPPGLPGVQPRAAAALKRRGPGTGPWHRPAASDPDNLPVHPRSAALLSTPEPGTARSPETLSLTPPGSSSPTLRAPARALIQSQQGSGHPGSGHRSRRPRGLCPEGRGPSQGCVYSFEINRDSRGYFGNLICTLALSIVYSPMGSQVSQGTGSPSATSLTQQPGAKASDSQAPLSPAACTDEGWVAEDSLPGKSRPHPALKARLCVREPRTQRRAQAPDLYRGGEPGAFDEGDRRTGAHVR